MNRNIFDELSPMHNIPNPTAPTLGEAPPPYSTLAPSNNDCETHMGEGAHLQLVNLLSTPTHLDCVDFIPRLLKKRLFGKNEYESFRALLERVNRWLEEHSDFEIISCETLTLFGQNTEEIFSDNTIFRQLTNSFFIRGFRLWYLKPVVPSLSNMGGNRNLQVTTLPLHAVSSFTQLTQLLNDQLANQSSIGRIIGIETVDCHVIDGALDVESTWWREDSSTRHTRAFAFRIYSFPKSNNIQQSIGYQDFVPSRTNRSKENRGFELFGDVMDRSSRWIARQQAVQFVNVQSINVKIKKNTKFEERCVYTDHGSGPMNFLRILRAYFVIDRREGAGANLPPIRLSYRTFEPRFLASSNNGQSEFENMRQLTDRINKWLKLTGGQVYKCETLLIAMCFASCSSKNLKSEATFQSTKDIPRPGKYITIIRVYLTGDYIETTEAAALVAST